MGKGLLIGLVGLLAAGCGGSVSAQQPVSETAPDAGGSLGEPAGGRGSDSAGSGGYVEAGSGGAPAQANDAGGAAGDPGTPMPFGGAAGASGSADGGVSGLGSGGVSGGGVAGASGAQATGGGGSGGAPCQAGGASGNGSDFSDCGCADNYIIVPSGHATPVTFTTTVLVKWDFTNGLCPQSSTVAIKLISRQLSCDADNQFGPTWTCSASGLGSQLTFTMALAVGDQVTLDVVYMPAYGAPSPGQVTGYSWTHIHSLPVGDGQTTTVDLSFPALPAGVQIAQAAVTKSAN